MGRKLEMDASDEPTQAGQPLDSARSVGSPASPKVFGRFVVFGRLGAGGMGQVLDARTHDGKPVALKLLRPEGEDDEARLAVARLFREAKILSALNIPGVVRVFEYGYVGRACYIAMERIDGKPLSAFLEHAPVGLDLVVSLGMRLAETLAHLHELGIVHRDIKPENIMVDEAGFPTLIDFGIAKDFRREVITDHGQIIGTPGYLAPEILADRSPTAHADQYALGRLLFTLCAGRPRNQGMTLAEMIVQGLRVDWSAYPSDRAYATLRKVLARMLAERPEDRYPDMYHCLVELEASLMDESTDPFSPFIPPPSTNWENELTDTRYQSVSTDLQALIARIDKAKHEPWLESDLSAHAAIRGQASGGHDPVFEEDLLLDATANERVGAEATIPEPSVPGIDTADLIASLREQSKRSMPYGAAGAVERAAQLRQQFYAACRARVEALEREAAVVEVDDMLKFGPSSRSLEFPLPRVGTPDDPTEPPTDSGPAWRPDAPRAPKPVDPATSDASLQRVVRPSAADTLVPPPNPNPPTANAVVAAASLLAVPTPPIASRSQPAIVLPPVPDPPRARNWILMAAALAVALSVVAYGAIRLLQHDAPVEMDVIVGHERPPEPPIPEPPIPEQERATPEPAKHVDAARSIYAEALLSVSRNDLDSAARLLDICIRLEALPECLDTMRELEARRALAAEPAEQAPPPKTGRRIKKAAFARKRR